MGVGNKIITIWSIIKTAVHRSEYTEHWSWNFIAIPPILLGFIEVRGGYKKIMKVRK